MGISKKRQSGRSLRDKTWLKLGTMLWQKKKETGMINKLFLIFFLRHTIKAKVMVIEIPEWKFKTIIVRNITFHGNWEKIISYFWVKNDKSVIIFEVFILVRRS